MFDLSNRFVLQTTGHSVLTKYIFDNFIFYNKISKQCVQNLNFAKHGFCICSYSY
jgi:hypothetical protein